MKASDCILFSGGAPGAEAAFGACAERRGIEEVNFTFDGHTIARGRGVRMLNHEELQAGESTVLSGGDTVIEREGMIHYGENLGTETVLIYTSTLFTTGVPGSTVYATPMP